LAHPFSKLKGWAKHSILYLSNVFSKLKTFYPFSKLKGWLSPLHPHPFFQRSSPSLSKAALPLQRRGRAASPPRSPIPLEEGEEEGEVATPIPFKEGGRGKGASSLGGEREEGGKEGKRGKSRDKGWQANKIT
jgi:hypothetical protein